MKNIISRKDMVKDKAKAVKTHKTKTDLVDGPLFLMCSDPWCDYKEKVKRERPYFKFREYYCVKCGGGLILHCQQIRRSERNLSAPKKR